MKSRVSKTGTRKIAAALAKGWTPTMRCGPCAFAKKKARRPAGKRGAI